MALKRALKLGLQFFATMLVLSLAVFYMARLAPGDPLKSYYGEGVERMSVSDRAAATARLGLDRPILTQYGVWAKNALAGDFGISLKYKRSVVSVIGGAWQNTLLLSGLAYLLTFALALPLGVFCALREDSAADRLICKAGAIANCLPSFWVALLLILLFSVSLGVLPSGGAYETGKALDLVSRMRHLVLPLAVLLLGHLWYYACMVRNLMLAEIRQDYVFFCRAKGLTRGQIVRRHCLRNILPAYIGMMAVSVPHLIGGGYVVEQVFSYPGLGTLCFESAKYHDYNLLMLLCLLTGAVVVAASLIAQWLCERLDPTLKREGGGAVGL